MLEPSGALPVLALVTGPPGSGKTTLAHALARTMGGPVVSRDEIMEGLRLSLERGFVLGTEPKLHVYRVFFQTLDALLVQGVGVIAEAAYQDKNWEPQLDRLLEIACVRVIVCRCDPAMARERWAGRLRSEPKRARFHELEGAGEPGLEVQPIRRDLPTLVVNTTEGYEPTLEAVAAFVLGAR